MTIDPYLDSMIAFRAVSSKICAIIARTFEPHVPTFVWSIGGSIPLAPSIFDISALGRHLCK